MKKIYRHIKFYIKQAMKSLRRHFGMTFSAATAISITLILISIFSLISANLANFTFNIEDQLTIRVSIDKLVTQEQRETLQQTITTLSGVKSVTYHSGDEELEAYKKEYQNDTNLFSMYEGTTSPIRDTFIVEANDATKLTAIHEEIMKLSGIVEAGYGGEATTQMLDAFEKIRDGSLVFIIFLVLVAAFLIGNKIKMSIFTRREEIAVMRNVGASNWFIKAPMMLEGICIGFLGAVLPIALTMVGYYYFYKTMQGIMLSNMFTLEQAFPLTLEISILLLAVGVFVGLTGSFVSTTKNLRWKR